MSGVKQTISEEHLVALRKEIKRLNDITEESTKYLWWVKVLVFVVAGAMVIAISNLILLVRHVALAG